ncbi:rhomboid family intramembrane serine protease [Corynebacterium urogenitale]|nr:rhomboid family intramembrane serine protease [Corynebacterium urogenitale]
MSQQSQPLRKLGAGAPVVAMFVAVCCATYALAALLGRSVSNPVRTPADWGWDFLLDAGRMEAYGQWWRPLSAAFIHLDPAHLFFNMFLIFLIGRELEQYYGSVVVGWSMLAAASGGALACLVMQPEVPMGGASTIGYAFCVMLIGLAFVRKQGLVAPFVLLAVNFGYTFFAGGVSLWGHVGGAVTGAVIAVLLAGGGRVRGRRLRGQGIRGSGLRERGLGGRGRMASERLVVGPGLAGFAVALTVFTCWAGVTGFFWH